MPPSLALNLFLLVASASLACGQVNRANAREWEGWGDWLNCPLTCGGSFQTRSRICSPVGVGPFCVGTAVDRQQCNTRPCPEWSLWGDWTDCSDKCGVGRQTRSRNCMNQPGICPGIGRISQNCNVKPCAGGNWGPWLAWSACPVACGIPGTRNRQRLCFGGLPGTCPGGASQSRDSEACPLKPCNDGAWLSWGPWAQCSKTCNGGTRERNRLCPAFRICTPGSGRETEFCRRQPCVAWAEWGVWAKCSKSCGGGGMQRRTRLCTGGAGCPGLASDMRICGLGACPLIPSLTNLGKSAKPADFVSLLSEFFTNLLRNPSTILNLLGLGLGGPGGAPGLAGIGDLLTGLPNLIGSFPALRDAVDELEPAERERVLQSALNNAIQTVEKEMDDKKESSVVFGGLRPVRNDQ